MVAQRLKVFLSLSIIFSLLSSPGCSPQDAAKAKPSLTVWHWMTDREPAFKELAKRYEAQAGIKVDFQLYAPSDAYSQKVRAAAQGNNLPDIFGVLGEKRDFASFIKAGHILNLYNYMAADEFKWMNSFYKKALSVNVFGPGNIYGVREGYYGVPIDIMTIQMLYNKKLLRQLGLNPPADFAEFLEAGRKIKAAGMQGMVSGWSETWMVDCFASNYAFNIMGEDKVLATIRGEVPYTDPDWVKVLALFKDLQASGVLAGGIVTMINKTAEQLFATDKAVFAFNGSWCVNVYKGMNPKLEYGVMLPPEASRKYPMSIWGGAGSSFMVNARSRKKEEALNFLRWLTDDDQQAYLAASTNNLPANKNSVSRIPEILASFSRNMDYATHPNVWGAAEFPLVTEAFDRGIQSIIIAKKTPEQVAAEVQKIKEKELARRRKAL